MIYTQVNSHLRVNIAPAVANLIGVGANFLGDLFGSSKASESQQDYTNYLQHYLVLIEQQQKV